MVDLVFPDQEDLTDTLVHPVLPVFQAQWEAAVKDIEEREEIRAMWVFPVQVELLEMGR